MKQGWYVLRGNQQVGPFPAVEVLKMRQTKELQEYDFVWCAGMPEWRRLNEVSELKDAVDSSSFAQRRHPRFSALFPVWVYDSSNAWAACSQTLSIGGAGIQVANPLLLPGQEVALHFKSSKDIEKSFNLQAEIVGKKFKKEIMTAKSKVFYSMRFVDIPKEIESYLHKLSEKSAA